MMLLLRFIYIFIVFKHNLALSYAIQRFLKRVKNRVTLTIIFWKKRKKIKN